MTRACFEPASFFFSGSVMAGCGGFAVVARAACERFFEDFGIGILHSVYGGGVPHPPRPTSANKPAGQDSWALMTPRLDDSTAPIADECQSFLDNVVGSVRARTSVERSTGSEFKLGTGRCPCSKIYPRGNGSQFRNVADDFASAPRNRPSNCATPAEDARPKVAASGSIGGKSVNLSPR